MTIHASQRERNVIRTIMVGLAGIDLAGALLIADGDERQPGTGVTSWVRVSLLPVSANHQGRIEGAKATREDVLVSCEVYHRGSSFDAHGAIDAVEAPVEALKAYFTALNLDLIDYVADPTGATAVAGVGLRFFRPPTRIRLDPMDGYQRHIVTAEATYFSRNG